MISQARTYLVGALSGVTLISAAIVVFAVLVSAQVFHDWPIAELGTHDQKSAVGPAKALPASKDTAATGSGRSTASIARPKARKATGNSGGANAASSKPANHGAAASEPGALAEVPAQATPTESSPSTGGHESSSGGNSGSHSSPPGSSSSPSGSNAGSSGGSSGSGGSGSNAPAGASSGSSGSSGGGSGSTATTPPATATKPAQTVAEAVNGTVAGVDEHVLGGTLEKTGVTEVTENLVNGVAGPESPVGKTVEGVAEAVGGLLGGGGH
ncbi:MAG: hypothetical protein JSS68_05035 [Actinobacteria bacterium]|nr:hypothetical protein [Actinomycetota bacterium]